MEASYLNEDPAYHFQIGRNDYAINFEGIPMNQRSADSEVQAARLVRERPMFEGTLMNQRSADPEVQAARLVRGRPMFEGTPMNQRSADPDVQAARFVSRRPMFKYTFMNQTSADPQVQAPWLVRRRPMFASKSVPQTTVTWVNADCALIISKSYQFFWKVAEREISSFVGCPGTELGFRSMKNRNTIMVVIMMMMVMMIFIIDSLHVNGCSVQYCCLSSDLHELN